MEYQCPLTEEALQVSLDPLQPLDSTSMRLLLIWVKTKPRVLAIKLMSPPTTHSQLIKQGDHK